MLNMTDLEDRDAFTITIVCKVDAHDVVTNEIDLMARITDFVADQVPRFFPVVTSCVAEGVIAL